MVRASTQIHNAAFSVRAMNYFPTGSYDSQLGLSPPSAKFSVVRMIQIVSRD